MVFGAPSMIGHQAMQKAAWSFLTKIQKLLVSFPQHYIGYKKVTSLRKFKRRQRPHLLMETVSRGLGDNVVVIVKKYNLTQKVLFCLNAL